MQEDTINVFCLSHSISLQTVRSNRVIICKENHVISPNFPNSGRWFYCCLCHKYWVMPKGQNGDTSSRQCPSCSLIKKARYYSCDQCNVTMIDSIGSINRKEIHITPWGTPHPHCPGCHQLPKSIPQSHACPELNGLLTTARSKCPFCEVQERDEGTVDAEESRNGTEILVIGGADEPIEPTFLPTVLEELERKAAAMRALEAEAEAREAKAQERLRQVEARLREEMSRRSELQRKSQELELELKRPPEISQSHLEAVRATSEAAAQFEEEMSARIAAEDARAEAEAKLREMEARASETEERLQQVEAGLLKAEERFRQAEDGLRQEISKRTSAEERLKQAEAAVQEEASKRASAEERLQQAESELQQESIKRSSTEARATELNIRFAAETEKIKAEAEAKIQGMVAETRRIEEHYKAEIDWIRSELETATVAVNQAESNVRQYQVKIEEAIASAQAAMFNLEETQKKLEVAEARIQETDTRAHQAENQLRQVDLILKMNSTLIRQVFDGTLKTNGKNGAAPLPFDLPAEIYEGLNGLSLFAHGDPRTSPTSLGDESTEIINHETP
jgi:hypothetical protein